MTVPVLPDLPELDRLNPGGPSPDRPRESPKATFDSEESRSRPNLAAQPGFTVHASKNGETSATHRTSPTITVAKARMLYKTGWTVHIADAAGRRYSPAEFDEILKFDPR
jgi:hypothetical protein